MATAKDLFRIIKDSDFEITEDTYYNYIYLNPLKPGNYIYGDLEFKYEPFYVGKGKGNRYVEHTRDAFLYKEKGCVNGVTNNKHKHNTILKILKEKNRIIVIILNVGKSEDKVLKDEINFIRIIGRKDLGIGPLLNATDGGQGKSGIVPIETRRKISEIKKGCTVSEETKEKIKKHWETVGYYPWTGRKHTEETKKKISDFRKSIPCYFLENPDIRYDWTGKKHKPETIEKMRNDGRRERRPSEESKRINREKHIGMYGKKPAKILTQKVFCMETGEYETMQYFMDKYDIKRNSLHKCLSKNYAKNIEYYTTGGITLVYAHQKSIQPLLIERGIIS